MASNFQVNKTDLDNIFKPLFTTKRADVGYQANNVDISTYYEPTLSAYDQAITNTGLYTSGIDLRYFFQGINYYNINKLTIITTPEKREKYFRRYNGAIYVYVFTEYLKQINGFFYVSVQVGGTIINQLVPIGPPAPATILFTFTGLGYGGYTVIATDLYANVSRAVNDIQVCYGCSYNNTYNFF